MMSDTETYIVKAKTVAEAIAAAKRDYEDANHEISYEILEMPKKGFLGLGAKEAEIKVTVSRAISVKSELGSLVADIKGMKVLTDRGGDGEKKQDKQNNNQKQQINQKQNGGRDKQNQQKPQNQQNNNQKQQQNNNQPKPNQEKPQEQEAKPAGNGKFGDGSYKTSLGNQAKPSTRRTRHIDGAGEAVDASAVTVSSPMGLTDFVAEDDGKTFGSASAETAGGNRMNNDIRRGKKQQPKPQEKSESTPSPAPRLERSDRGRRNDRRNDRRGDRRPRYDMAESDDDYAKLDRMVREGEEALESEATLFPAKEAPVREDRRREAITQEEMDYALAFANKLLENMQLGAKAEPAECPEGEEFDVTETATVYPKINIVGDDTGILIGHHGETLDAIQYLVNLSALRKTRSQDGDYVKIVVDIENYRQKREDTLRTLARRMAARAVKYKRNVFLEPMNAYERRIIHSELQNFENVSTHSVGADRDRKIIITYEGPDKQPDRPRRRREDGDRLAHAPKPQQDGEKFDRPRRRPRKPQKMPIEKLTEILPEGDEGNEE